MELRSHTVTQGVERVPHRSLFYACCFKDEELNRPLIGAVSTHSEIVPGCIYLDKLVDAAKTGAGLVGGTPILIPAIGVCGGIAILFGSIAGNRGEETGAVLACNGLYGKQGGGTC